MSRSASRWSGAITAINGSTISVWASKWSRSKSSASDRKARSTASAASISISGSETSSLHRQLHAGVPGEERRQQRGEVERPERLHRADHHPAGADADQVGEIGARRVDLGQRAPGARATSTRPASVSSTRRVVRLTSGQPDLGFEPPQLLGERGLRDVLTSRRAGEVSLVGERDEVAQLAQFHKRSA